MEKEFVTRENIKSKATEILLKNCSKDNLTLEQEQTSFLQFIIKKLTEEIKQNKTRKFDREDLEWYLDNLIDKYDEEIKNFDLPAYEYDDLSNFCKEEIIKIILPIWKDTSSNYINLGKLIENYDLDVDELYFDKDTQTIRDEQGNVWAD